MLNVTVIIIITTALPTAAAAPTAPRPPPLPAPLTPPPPGLCHPPTLEALSQGRTLTQIKALWKTDLAKFTSRRAKHLLYE